MSVHPVIDAIRQARRVRGWKQSDLAAAARVGVNTISAWESGAKEPQLGRLLPVLDALNLHLVVVPCCAATHPAQALPAGERQGVGA